MNEPFLHSAAARTLYQLSAFFSAVRSYRSRHSSSFNAVLTMSVAPQSHTGTAVILRRATVVLQGMKYQHVTVKAELSSSKTSTCLRPLRVKGSKNQRDPRAHITKFHDSSAFGQTLTKFARSFHELTYFSQFFCERYVVNVPLLRSLFRPSVCLSVTRLSCAQTQDFLHNLVIPPGRPGSCSVIKMRENIRNRFSRVLLCRTDYEKNRDFRPVSRFMRNDTRYGHSYNGIIIGTYTRPTQR